MLKRGRTPRGNLWREMTEVRAEDVPAYEAAGWTIIPPWVVDELGIK